MKVKPIAEIEEVARRIADLTGVEFLEAEFRTSPRAELNVTVDTEDGVDLDTLEKFHRAFDAALDELDPTFGEPYTLNVSSPGLDRPFKTPRDFERAIGEEVEVRLYSPLKGKKLYEGFLADYDGNSVTLDCGGQEIKIELTRVAKINKAIKFD